MVDEHGESKPAEKKRAGCFKVGCFGCLGLGAILVIVPGFMFLIALIQGAPDKDPESETISHTLPGVAGQPPALPLDSKELQAPPSGTDGAAQARPGNIILDVRMGEFTLVPGKPGEPIKVEADYDAGGFELVESFHEDDGDGWTYELTFDTTIGWFRHILRGGIDGGENKIRLTVPPNVPLTVAGVVGIGMSDMEMGGLWVTDLDLKVGIGEHRLSFSEPLPVPMEEMYIDASVGELSVRRLGNASPRQAVLTHSIGEVGFDLRGDWVEDSDITLRCGIGECRVRLPGDDVNLELERATLTIGERNTHGLRGRDEAPEGAPTVRLNVSQSIGEMQLQD